MRFAGLSLALALSSCTEEGADSNWEFPVRRLNLIRGTLDACSSVASITWVQPRVLDKTQIGGLKDRLGDWADKVQAQGAFARGVAPELFA